MTEHSVSGDEMVVARFSDGRIVKGCLASFSPVEPELVVEETGSRKLVRIGMQSLKAIFFVRSYEGDSSYRDKKRFKSVGVPGSKVYVKFKDGESLVGYLEGDVPWKRGFFLSGARDGAKGFFLLPVDDQANNKRVFVVSSSVNDVTIIP